MAEKVRDTKSGSDLGGDPGVEQQESREVLTREERGRVMRSLFLSPPLRFAFLLSLSIVIAVMGLSLDSPAVVIGAMLIAPLMTPVVAFAAAVAMGWPRWMARMGGVVLVASVGSVALAWLLASLLPTSDLTREVLSRTSPDARDLLVAIAAGAAGAYAMVREDLSAALPGVAVAVALVPPLAGIGVVLEAGRYDLAVGAMLLYTANLVAIVVSGVAVLLATGFVPIPHLERVRPRVAAACAGLLGALVLIGVPLTKSLLTAAHHAVKVREASEEVERWLGSAGGLEATRVKVEGQHVIVDVVGHEPPPPARLLAEALADELGSDAQVEVRWSQRMVSTAREPRTAEQEATRDREEAWRPLVEEWLTGRAEFEVLSLQVDGARALVEVAGPVPPPDAGQLASLAAERFGRSADVTVHWIERRSYRARPGQEVAQEGAERARAVASAWARARSGLDVVAVEVTDTMVTVDIAGEQAPEVLDLVSLLQRELGSSTQVVVRFSQRERLFPGIS